MAISRKGALGAFAWLLFWPTPCAYGQGVFFSQTDYGVGSQPAHVFIADLNKDGRLDLAVANSGSNSVSILLGQANGVFGAETDFAAGMNPVWVIVGDFNGDTNLDLVTANRNGNNVSILLGTGTGSFGAPANFATGTAPTSVGVGLFNNDANLDLAVTNSGADTISVLLGNGNGTFATKVDYLTGAMPNWILVDDFNADTNLDLASANPGSNTVSVLLGAGDGTFGTRSDFATGVFPRAVAAGDFRNLMRRDLATANTNDNTVSVLLSQGDGGFDPRTDLGTDTGPLAVTSADFDNDGKPDLITSNLGAAFGYFYYYYYPTLTLLRGNGDGTFMAGMNFFLGYFFNQQQLPSVASADFNGDGRTDVVITNQTQDAVSVLLQAPRISVSPCCSVQVATNQMVGTTSPPQMITVSSTGAVNLTIGTVTLTGAHPGDFAKPTDTCSGNAFAPATSCQIEVTFTPSASGLRTAELSIPNNSPSNPVSVVLSGVGAGNGMVSLSATSLNFGDVREFTDSPTQPVTLTNTGTEPITLLDFSLPGDFFAFHDCVTPLAASAACTVHVGFRPSSPGPKASTLTITSDTLGSPNTISLSGNGTPAPQISVTPSFLFFGDQLVGTTSAPQPITVTNTSQAPLAIFNVETFTQEFSQTNNCPASLAPGAMCQINVTFAPGSALNFTDSLRIQSDAGNNPTFFVDLEGNGITPASVLLSSASASFGTQIVGTTSGVTNVTLTNGGTLELTITAITLGGADPTQFGLAHNCPVAPSTLAGGGMCTLMLTFSPTTLGAKSASVSITSDAAGSPHTVMLSGNGTFAPRVDLMPPLLDFGIQNVGTTSAPQVITLTNTGQVALLISSIAVTTNPQVFAQTNNCPLAPATLAAGGMCQISVTFTPTGVLDFIGFLTVTSDALGSPHGANLAGTGFSPPAVMLSSTSVTFTAQVVGSTSASQMVTLTNSGGSTLNITSMTLGGADPTQFGLAHNCPVAPSTLAGGGMCTLMLTFSPTTPGAKSASVSITSDAAGSPHAVMLSGTGINPPAVMLSSTSVTFTAQVVGSTSASQMVTLTNSGGSTLNITSMTLGGANPGDFTRTDNCGTSLNAGANCAITLAFRPTAAGMRAAAVSIASNAAGSPHSISLAGTATDFSLTPAQGSSTTMTINAGQSATFSITIPPANGFAGMVTLACTGSIPLGGCTVPASINVDGVNAATFMVTVTTTANAALPSARPWPSPPGGPMPVAWFAIGALLAAMALATRRRAARPAWALVLLLVILSAACAGGNGGFSGTPPGTYPLTVTGTAAGQSRSVGLSVTVR